MDALAANNNESNSRAVLTDSTDCEIMRLQTKEKSSTYCLLQGALRIASVHESQAIHQGYHIQSFIYTYTLHMLWRTKDSNNFVIVHMILYECMYAAVHITMHTFFSIMYTRYTLHNISSCLYWHVLLPQL